MGWWGRSKRKGERYVGGGEKKGKKKGKKKCSVVYVDGGKKKKIN